MAIDAVTERSFYYNITLRVMELLEEHDDVVDIQMKHKKPCDLATVSTWEKENSCVLPIDIKNFYLSIDGFELVWSLLGAGEPRQVGSMRVNKLRNFRRINMISSESDDFRLVEEVLQVIENQHCPTDIRKPMFSNADCKIFLLEDTKYVGAICAVISGKIAESPIWLLDFSYDWHLLAPNFTKYFRMMIYYQGLPEWQLMLTPYGLSPWAEQIMNEVTPQLSSPPPAPKNWEPTNIELDQNILKAAKSKQVNLSGQDSELNTTEL